MTLYKVMVSSWRWISTFSTSWGCCLSCLESSLPGERNRKRSILEAQLHQLLSALHGAALQVFIKCPLAWAGGQKWKQVCSLGLHHLRWALNTLSSPNNASVPYMSGEVVRGVVFFWLDTLRFGFGNRCCRCCTGRTSQSGPAEWSKCWVQYGVGLFRCVDNHKPLFHWDYWCHCQELENDFS